MRIARPLLFAGAAFVLLAVRGRRRRRASPAAGPEPAARRRDVVDEASEGSFPASDPPAWTGCSAS